MQNEKKLTKDDTWRSADLRKYIKERDGDERKHRRGESSERRHRDPDRETRRDRDKLREKESARERRDVDDRQRQAEGRKEGSKDRRSDRVRREERDGERRERDKLPGEKLHSHHYKEDGEKRREAEARRHSERDANRHRDKERERGERRRAHDSNDDKRKQDRRREERHGGHAAQRERGDGDRDRDRDKDRAERHDREKRERHRERERYREGNEDKGDDKERRERREDRRHLDTMEKNHKEEHRRHSDEKERRHKERRDHDEKREHRRDSGDHRGVKGEEDVRHRRVGDRERAERDEHRERAPRAEVELGRNRRRETTKESEKSHRPEAKAEDAAPKRHTVEAEAAGITEEAVVSDEAYQEYEDDFEDYEEDFEETDESAKDSGDEEPQHTDEDGDMEEPKTQRRKEVEAIQKAMNEENQRVGTTQTQTVLDRRRDDGDGQKLSKESASRGSQRGKFIDFVAAKQREVNKQAASKQKKRSVELLRLIELDFSTTFSILDLPPVNEYDMYIKNFGNANTKQAYVQCNEDNADRDIQTEDVEMCEKWTQHPPESGGACGDPNLSPDARASLLSETGFDSQRLVAFLRSASQVMTVLLEEEQAERKTPWKPRSQSQNLSFSDGSLQLNTRLPFLYGRSVSLVHFSRVQRFTMMSVHSPTAKPSAVRLDSCTVICIWNIWEPSRPQKVLVYESDVQCCCFSPCKATLVFAGTAVGSVLLWDLREQASSHYRLTIGQEDWTFRQPTFSTDAVMANSGHQSPVTSVEVVPFAAGGDKLESPLLASEEDSSGLSFQLASLDETGVLNFWVVIELPKANKAGSPTDLGLRPGGKVKLLHSSSVLAAERSPRDAAKMTALQTLHLRFFPTDSSHFCIGTNMGLVNHGTSHGVKASPKFYRCREAGARPVEVTSIHFSPFKPQFFLVGCLDGSIRLHAVSCEQPVAEWHSSAAVVSLQWSQTRATVFCMLDAASNLHVWDLSKSDTEPVVIETVNSDRATAMALFGDLGQHNTYAGVALARQSGTIDLQYFPKHFASPGATEAEKLEKMMAEASCDS